MATKIFDNPNNDMEREIADHIKPLVTTEVEEKITKDKLTLKGCWEFCKNKGKKFAVNGVARVSDEQHWKWVREYFGIKGNVTVLKADIPNPVTAAPAEEKPKAALDVDFDSLFD